MQKSILFSLLFFSIQIIAPPILAQPIRKTAKPISWQKRAKADLASIKKVLQENHPGAVDEGSNNIKKWLADSKKQLAERLPLVADEASYKALLSWYVCGFQDGLTSIKFALTRKGLEANPLDHHVFRKTPQTLEWPGIQMSYDPTSKSFCPTPNGYDLTGCLYHIGYRVIKIDDLDPRAWIEKNIIPFESGARLGIESTYVNMAPWALVWKNNPFAEKPKTITVHSMMMKKYLIIGEDGKPVPNRPSTETLTLNWKPITTRELATKRKVLQTPTQNKNAHIISFKKTESSSHPYDVYVKIPSFNGENSEIAESLNQVAEKLNHQIQHLREKKNDGSPINIIFDLRGNTGGNSSAVTKILRGLDCENNGDYYEQWKRVRSQYEVWWRATPANASWLSKTTCESLSAIEKTEVSNLTKSVQRSVDIGEQFFKEQMPRMHTTEWRGMYPANIDIIIDGDCSGATLDFIDRIKLLRSGNVGRIKLIGQQTAPYSMYMRACKVVMNTASTHKTVLTHPIAIRKDLSSQHGQPYTPDHILSNSLMHPRSLEATNTFLEKITNALRPSTRPTPEEPVTQETQS